MGLSKLWGKDSTGAHGFVFSHIKTIYYNWAQKKLLSTKLDEMDTDTESRLEKSKTLDDYASIMSNQTAGFWPDALAVKEGFAQLNTDLNAYDTVTVSLGSIQGAGGIVFSKKAGVVQMFMNAKLISPGLQYGTDYPFTVPEGFRPKVPFYSYFVQGGSILLFVGISANGSGYIRVPTNGEQYAGWMYQEFMYVAG